MNTSKALSQEFVFRSLDEHILNSKVDSLSNQTGHFMLVWVRSGSGQLRIDMETVPVRPNTLYHTFPGQFSNLYLQDEVCGYVISFSEKFITNRALALPTALEHLLMSGRFKMLECGCAVGEEVEEIFQKIRLENDNELLSKQDMLHGLISLVLSFFFPKNQVDEKQKQRGGYEHLIWLRFIGSVNTNFRTKKLVWQYASELSVSPNYLTELVRKASSHSPRHHIHQRILLEAKRMAISTSLPAVEIAGKLGFDNPFTFSKFFKLLTGTTFTDFRKYNRFSQEE